MRIAHRPFSVGCWLGKRALSTASPSAQSLFTQESFYSEIRKELSLASTIPPVAYHSKEFMEIEKTNIFEKSWTCVGTIFQVQSPGETLVCEVGTQPIIITRNKKGELKAFKNVCRHRGNILCSKSGRYPTLMCRYHRWAYDLDGELVATPLFSQSDSEAVKKSFDTSHVQKFDKKQFGLFPVRMQTLGHLIFVNVSKTAPELNEYLGDIPDQLSEYLPALSNTAETVVVRSRTVPAAANWKLLIENFIEYYHLPSVHPSLVQVSGMDEHVRLQGRGCYVGLGTDPLTPANTPLDPYYIPHFPTLPENSRNHKKAIFHAIFPNIFYFCLPHSMFTVICTPDRDDPTKSVEYAEMAVTKKTLELPDAKERLDAMWNFYDLTNNEDVEVCTTVQRGTAAHEYQGGRLSFRFEETIHRFQNMVVDHMIGHPRIPEGDDTATPGADRSLNL
jgi:choline monooxygenase